jgi:hypothetical protein
VGFGNAPVGRSVTWDSKDEMACFWGGPQVGRAGAQQEVKGVESGFHSKKKKKKGVKRSTWGSR